MKMLTQDELSLNSLNLESERTSITEGTNYLGACGVSHLSAQNFCRIHV